VRDTLYIQLRDAAPDATVTYALASGGPGAAVQAQQGTLDNVLALAAGRRIVLFVPGIDVRLASVQVPARQAQKILQAAPYALEDQLAEDVETLHFAIAAVPQRRRANDPHPVALVARARMDEWLAPLRARGLKPDAIIPETLSLPPPEGGRWTALAEPGRVTVRTGPFTGFACTLEDFGSYLQLADPEAHASLRLFVAREVEYDFTRLGRPTELLPGYASALEVLVRGYRPDTSIDLLQGGYSQAEDWQRLARPWRIAAGIAVAWVAIAIVSEGAQAFRDGQELERLDQANIARYQELFPGTTRFENLSLQAQQQLAALRAGGTRAPLFQLLDAVAASLTANPGLTLQSLQFREGVLYVSLTGTDLQPLENLRAWFGAHPETVLSVQDTNAAPDGVQIRLKLSLA
jgi:general secretion pathway protein L